MPLRKSVTAFHVNKVGVVNPVVLVYVDGDEMGATRGWNCIVAPPEVNELLTEGVIDTTIPDSRKIIAALKLQATYLEALHVARKQLDERIAEEESLSKVSVLNEKLH